MKAALSIILSISYLVSAQSQDIFVFKNGTIRTCYKIVQEFKTSLQVETPDGAQSYITLDQLSFVQPAKGNQFIYDHATHPMLALADAQEPNEEQCSHPAKNGSGAVNASTIDNQTPGKKATVIVARASLFRNRCLTTVAIPYLVKGDEVTIEKSDGIVSTPPFTGSYLVNFKRNDGLVIKAWVNKHDIAIQHSK